MKITLAQFKLWAVFAIGLASAGYAAYAAVAHTAGVTPAAIVAAVLLAVERFVSDPSTGTPAPAAAPAVPTPPAA